MVDLPKREQACPTFDTLYTLAKKLEAGQLAHTYQYTPSSDIYRERHRCYPVLAGRVAALEEERLVLTDPVSGEDSESEVEAVDGLNMHLAQVNALADSGSQVNTITPTLVQQYGFPVLPLEDLFDHPLNLVGLGRKCMSSLSFIILHVQVWEIAGYDEDIVFLMVPDESEFS